MSILNKTEKLRREKISATLKTKHANKELIQWNIGMKMSEEYRNKLSDYWKTHDKIGRFSKGMIPWNKGLKGYMSGKINGNYKDGNSKTWRTIYQSIEYRDWRKQVFERDNYTCQVCDKTNCVLNAHHIKRYTKYPKLVFCVDNGETLCVDCHNKKHTNKPR